MPENIQEQRADHLTSLSFARCLDRQPHPCGWPSSARFLFGGRMRGTAVRSVISSIRISLIQLPQIPDPYRKRHLGTQQRLALQLLAGTPFGATEVIMFANGFTRRVLAGLIRAGLVTAQREMADGQLVSRLRITEAVDGRSKVIDEWRRRARPDACFSRMVTIEVIRLIITDAGRWALQR
jgi:hypothetical protein